MFWHVGGMAIHSATDKRKCEYHEIDVMYLHANVKYYCGVAFRH